MARGEQRGPLESELAAALQAGSASVSMLLLRLYKRLDISDTEAMLLIHLIAFKEKEGKEFPTPQELQSRMSAPPEAVIKALQRLLKEELLQIDEAIDPSTGVLSETYNLSHLYRRLAGAWLEETGAAGKAPAAAKAAPAKAGESDIFTMFEKEFARPLTPMECENISQWLDRDRYPEELILLALKEAVFAGVVHFRYIDRILLEWSRNRVQTPEQAKQYTQKFRGAR
ncbi:DnaD domain-containing protein [Paenibacillus sp. GYB003]|uniref:DnaD domain-containing protein n=1 Tax=Paenibacillus sp. GYB003 TaxID=2994392 RepID=UPI002F966D6E